MEATDAIGVVQTVIVLAVMAAAAASDARMRRVGDPMWCIMCASGIPLAAAGIAVEHGVAMALPYAAGAALLAWYMLSPRLVGMLAVPPVAAGLALMIPATAGIVGTGMSAIVFASAVLLHRTGLLTGGADAKCVMSLALVLPSAPETTLVWPPSLLPPALPILMLALVLSLLWFMPTLARNVASGHLTSNSLTTVEVDVRTADPDLHWPISRLEDGRLVPCRASPDDAREIFEELRAAGIDRIRVVPTIPFIVPMATATIAVMLLGDPLASRCRGRTRRTRTWGRPAPTGPPSTRTSSPPPPRTTGSTCPPRPRR